MRRCAAGTIRVWAGIVLGASLAACAAQHPPRLAAPIIVPTPAQLCTPNPAYIPPGAEEDPWGPYIRTAATRFAVPEPWVREVMRQESGGHQYLDGCLTTSPVGAMGLMQVMPATYAGLRLRYGLGEDPYLPRDNILAGTAYIREMYDRFGAPGFLAAYNAGPQHLDDFLAGAAPLPDETVGYVDAIAPRIGYSPEAIPGWGAVQARFAQDHSADALNRRELAGTGMALAAADVSYRAVDSAATADLNRRELAGFDPAAVPAGGWAIQVGAFSSIGQAWTAATAARDHAPGPLGGARPTVTPTAAGPGMLYRARLTGLSADGARAACGQLAERSEPCVLVTPATAGPAPNAAGEDTRPALD